MDFSEMFNTSGRNNAANTVGKGMINHDENISPNSTFKINNNENDEKDSTIHLSTYLKSINKNIEVFDISPSVANTIEVIIKESLHWKRQYYSLTEQCEKVKGEIDTVSAEKERETQALEVAQRENHQLHMRLSALAQEQRDVRAHWLAEKNDLQNRFFHIQSLNTQLQGTLKKKEKDFERLQSQLGKIAQRDNTRASVAKTTTSANRLKTKDQQVIPTHAFIQISTALKPSVRDAIYNGDNASIQRFGDNSAAPAVALLKDAELQASRSTISVITSENQALRSNMENLQQQVEHLRNSLECTIQAHETKLHHQLHLLESERNSLICPKPTQSLATKESCGSVTTPVNDSSVPVEMKKTAQSAIKFQIENIESIGASPQSTVAQVSQHTPDVGDSQTRRQNMQHTPGVPVSWIVEQANTEVKKLRERAEDVATGKILNLADDINEPGAPCTAILMRSKVQNMRKRLTEALSVIQEQDRLIHAALIGKPFDLCYGDFCDESVPYSSFGTDQSPYIQESEGLSDATKSESATSAEVMDEVLRHIAAVTSGNHIKLRDSDLLPPATPETIALLEKYGWSSLPRVISETVTTGNVSSQDGIVDKETATAERLDFNE